ncbi:MAG: hypothetical protein ACLPLR_00285 [Terriglobales bacterium]
MNTTLVAEPKAKKRTPIGGQISLIVTCSVVAGSHLESFFLRRLSPHMPYEWTEEFIIGVGFLIAAIAFAVRLHRETTFK